MKMIETETPITIRLKKTLGRGFDVYESPIGRAERVHINKLKSLVDGPSKEEVDGLAGEIFNGVDFRARDYQGQFFDTFSTTRDHDVVLEFFSPAKYYGGHFVVFGNGSHVMLSLVWRGRYPTKQQEGRYVRLVDETYRRFYKEKSGRK